MEGTLIPSLNSQALVNIAIHDYTKSEDIRLLMAMSEQIALPDSFNSHLYTFIQRGDSVRVLLGHPPSQLIRQALQEQGMPKKLVVGQEEMKDNPGSYELWAFQGEVKRFEISMALDEALDQLDLVQGGSSSPDIYSSPVLLSTVLLSGLADGINPCAFAVMAFFTALLFALRRTRGYILRMGSAYIAGMYVTYFALGLGLLRVLTLVGQPHIITQAGGLIAIVMGLIQVKDGLWPNLPIHLTMPTLGWQATQTWARRTSTPAALVLGGLVGLCTLPCSGGIYVAILGLLSSQVSYTAGLGYLALYNVMFILPLLVILLVINSRPMSLALAGWERTHARSMHTAIGIVMVLLGILILGWLH